MDNELLSLVGLLVIKLKKKKDKDARKIMRRWGVRPINRTRNDLGFFTIMYYKMKEADAEEFFKYTRMPVATFEQLLSLVKLHMHKNSKTAISPEMRLALTLSYLSQGDSMRSLAWSYRLGKTTVRNIALENCYTIFNVLKKDFLPTPAKLDWKKIASEFEDKWNMPNCTGAIDGKHFAIQMPPNSGSEFYNHKHFFSIVLMATCDANYRFTSVEVGFAGSESDGGIFRRCSFGHCLLSNSLDLPNSCPLPNSNIVFPYYFVGDAAFPLKENLQKPYPGKLLCKEKIIYNYRLSRARRCIENAFGITCARWRIMLTTLNLTPRNARTVVLACVTLHNYFKQNESNRLQMEYCPLILADVISQTGEELPGQWRAEVQPLASLCNIGSNRCSNESFKLRDILKNYVNGIGAVAWQENALHK